MTTESTEPDATLTPEQKTYFGGLVDQWNVLCQKKEKEGTPLAWDDLSDDLKHEVEIRGARQLFEGERPISTVGGVVGALVNEVFVPLLHRLTGREFIDDGVVQ